MVHQCSLRTDFRPGHGAVPRNVGQRIVPIHAEFHEEAHPDGSRPADSGCTVDEEVLPAVDAAHHLAEQRTHRVERGGVQILDREPERGNTALRVSGLDRG